MSLASEYRGCECSSNLVLSYYRYVSRLPSDSVRMQCLDMTDSDELLLCASFRFGTAVGVPRLRYDVAQ